MSEIIIININIYNINLENISHTGSTGLHSWKDQKCPFRSSPKGQIRVLPTLVKWGTQKRLEGNQLLDDTLIEMLLCEDDD